MTQTIILAKQIAQMHGYIFQYYIALSFAIVILKLTQ